MLRLFCNTRKFNFFLNCALFTYLSVLHWCFALYNLILRIHCHKTNTTGVTSGEGTAYPSESPGFIPVFSGVCVAQSLVFYVVFCRSLCVFSLMANVFVCPLHGGFLSPSLISSIYSWQHPQHNIVLPCVYRLVTTTDELIFKEKKTVNIKLF
jgi:hypothetical protein